MTATATSSPTTCPCGAPRQLGFTRCAACRAARLAADPPPVDHAILARLDDQRRRCCRCPALDHGPDGCRWCMGCKVTGEQHPAHEEAAYLEAWLEAGYQAGAPLAPWVEGWRREEVPADQRRPEPVTGELRCPSMSTTANRHALGASAEARDVAWRPIRLWDLDDVDALLARCRVTHRPLVFFVEPGAVLCTTP